MQPSRLRVSRRWLCCEHFRLFSECQASKELVNQQLTEVCSTISPLRENGGKFDFLKSKRLIISTREKTQEPRLRRDREEYSAGDL